MIPIAIIAAVVASFAMGAASVSWWTRAILPLALATGIVLVAILEPSADGEERWSVWLIAVAIPMCAAAFAAGWFVGVVYRRLRR